MSGGGDDDRVLVIFAFDCDDCAGGSLCAACGDDVAFSEARDERCDQISNTQGEAQ